MTQVSTGSTGVDRADLVTLTIDGVSVSVPRGTLVIRAAEQIGLLVYALRLSTPRNQLAFDAREAALAAVEFDLQHPREL